jgi:hypothetical protein
MVGKSKNRRRTVSDGERPNISSPIRNIKMYSYAQCTVQERLVCSGDVPCLAQEEQGSGPSTLSTYPPPYLPGVVGTQFTGSLQEGWIWTVKWRFVASPAQILCFWIMYAILSLFHLESCFLKCLSNDWLPSTDCCYIFRLINHYKK